MIATHLLTTNGRTRTRTDGFGIATTTMCEEEGNVEFMAQEKKETLSFSRIFLLFTFLPRL